jgi:Flp pilus assembly protein TadG
MASSLNKKRAESGQSLVEFALLLPIMLLVLLGAVNLGLAIRAQLQLAQVTQQAAQYLVHHPFAGDPSTSCDIPPDTTLRYCTLVAYMNGLSSYHLNPLEVSLTVGTSSIPVASTTSLVQQDTISVHYPFPLIFPMIGALSVGMLSNGSINLGATASTVAGSHAVGSLTVCAVESNSCPDLPYVPAGTTGANPGTHEIYWTPPVEASSISLPLKYCVRRVYVDISSSTFTLISSPPFYYDQTFPRFYSNGCVTAGNSNLSTPQNPVLFFTDDFNLGPTRAAGIQYTVNAIQANGMLSDQASVAS